MIDGDLAYGSEDQINALTDPEARAGLEPLVASGKRMFLDTTYRVRPSGETPPRLAQLRADLINEYPQVGPIFA
jgi:hypothetical protein